MAEDRSGDMRRVPNSAAPIYWPDHLKTAEDHDLRSDAGYMYSKVGMTPDDVHKAAEDSAARHAEETKDQ
jgi:hypothetical protein